MDIGITAMLDELCRRNAAPDVRLVVMAIGLYCASQDGKPGLVFNEDHIAQRTGFGLGVVKAILTELGRTGDAMIVHKHSNRAIIFTPQRRAA